MSCWTWPVNNDLFEGMGQVNFAIVTFKPFNNNNISNNNNSNIYNNNSSSSSVLIHYSIILCMYVLII